MFQHDTRAGFFSIIFRRRGEAKLYYYTLYAAKTLAEGRGGA